MMEGGVQAAPRTDVEHVPRCDDKPREKCHHNPGFAAAEIGKLVFQLLADHGEDEDSRREHAARSVDQVPGRESQGTQAPGAWVCRERDISRERL